MVVDLGQTSQAVAIAQWVVLGSTLLFALAYMINEARQS